MPEPLLDTNVIIHAHTSDAQSAECRTFLKALEEDRYRALLPPMVLHELSYALPRYVKQVTRPQLAKYLLMIVDWPGVVCEKAVLRDAVTRWASTPGLSFVDAYLIAVALAEGRTVVTKNIAEFQAAGATVLDPLPDGNSP